MSSFLDDSGDLQAVQLRHFCIIEMFPYDYCVQLSIENLYRLSKMGYDLLAYIDADQDEVDKIILENKLDRNDWDARCIIVEKYKQVHPEIDMDMMYSFNDRCSMHELYCSHGTNFIRDDERFTNRRYHSWLEQKLGKPFPKILQAINWSLRDAQDAVEIAEGLETFFADDESLQWFAKWCRETAKLCSTYELDR